MGHLAKVGGTAVECGEAWKPGAGGYVTRTWPTWKSDITCPGCRAAALSIADVKPTGATQGDLFSLAPEVVYSVEDRWRGERLRRARAAAGVGVDGAAARLGVSATVYCACERGEKAFDLELAELWLGSPL